MMTRFDSRRAFWLLVILFFVNVVQSIVTPLHFDEVYYWVFSKRLDWGYFDHPPMVAVSMALGGCLGDGSGLLRLCTVLIQPVWIILFLRSMDFHLSLGEVRRLDLLLLLLLSLPIIHLTGFVSTPDAPLMLFSFLFLYGFYVFDRLPSWGGILWLGFSMAGMAYSKYHGALVVLFAVLWRLRMLRDWRFYASCMLALLLFLPHLLWQYDHDFASFTYHLSERSRDFSWDEVGSFALTLFLGFNPFLFPLFLRSFRLSRRTEWERLLHFVSVGFILFCAVMSVRGHVQLQWMAVSSLGYAATIYRMSLSDRKVRRYVMRVSVITASLFLLLRIALLFDTPLWQLTGLGRDKNEMEMIHERLGDVPVLLTDNYFKTASYQYYGHFDATYPPNMFKRGNQYRFFDDELAFVGRPVAFESALGSYSISLGAGREFRYDLLSNFLPTKHVKATLSLVEESHQSADSIALKVLWHNPYSHSVPLSGQDGSFVRILIGKKGEYVYNEVQPDAATTIAAGGDLECYYVVPRRESKSGDIIFICIERPPLPYFYSGRLEIE